MLFFVPLVTAEIKHLKLIIMVVFFFFNLKPVFSFLKNHGFAFLLFWAMPFLSSGLIPCSLLRDHSCKAQCMWCPGSKADQWLSLHSKYSTYSLYYLFSPWKHTLNLLAFLYTLLNHAPGIEWKQAHGPFVYRATTTPSAVIWEPHLRTNSMTYKNHQNKICGSPF